MHQRLFLIIYIHSSGDEQTQRFGCLNIRFKIGLRPVADIWTQIKTPTHKRVFYKGSTAKWLQTKRDVFLTVSGWTVLDSTVWCFQSKCIFYKHSHQDVLLAFIDTPKQISVFTGKRCNFQSSRWVIFTRTYLLRTLYYPWKKIQGDCQEKNLPFLISSEDRRKFSIFLASDSLI